MRKVIATVTLLGTLVLPSFAFADVTPISGDCSTVISVDNTDPNSAIFYKNASGDALTNKINAPTSGALSDLIPDCSTTFTNGDTINIYKVNRLGGAFSQCYLGASYAQCVGNYAENWNGGAGYVFTYNFTPPPPPGGPKYAGFMGSSTAMGAGVILAGFTSTEAGQAILLTMIASSVFIAFYIIEQLIMMFGRRSRERKGIKY